MAQIVKTRQGHIPDWVNSKAQKARCKTRDNVKAYNKKAFLSAGVTWQGHRSNEYGRKDPVHRRMTGHNGTGSSTTARYAEASLQPDS